MRRTRIGLGALILAVGLFLAAPSFSVAAPVEINVWSAFPELHDQVTWIAGLTGPACYHVFVLRSPTRLVIDFRAR